MSYNKAIPAAADRLKDSQPDILENFATISALLGVDHVISPWTDPATGDQGKHNKVTLPEQTVAPNPDANEMALYTKEENSVSQLFVRREGPGGTEINLTNDVLKDPEGWTRLPNGLIVKWGYIVGTGARDLVQSHNLPDDVGVAIPRFTTVYSVNVAATNRINNVVQTGTSRFVFPTLESFAIAAGITNISVNQVGTFNAGGNAHDWTYIAIGI